MFKTIIVTLCMIFLVNITYAQGSLHDKMSYTKIDKVDLNNRTVTIAGKVYGYQMIDEEDSFYASENSTKNMKYLTLGKKYYVNIQFNNSKDRASAASTGIVNYIGSVKQPF